MNSEAVDWRLCYAVPQLGEEVSLDELCARIPDLQKEYTAASETAMYSPINEMTFSDKEGFKAKVREDSFARFKSFYEQNAYIQTVASGWSTVTADANTFAKNIPLFVHSYVNKTFGAIPSLHLAAPFASGVYYSQLGITYMLAYILGMLVRYYPTHWIALIQSEKGDMWWPTINCAQHFIEVSYPELVIEMIRDILNESQAAKATSEK